MNFGKPRRGQDHPLARLSNDQAKAIREQLNTGRSTRDLGREYQVSHGTIRRIRDRLSYDDKETW